MSSILNDTLPLLTLFAPAFTPATFARVQLLAVAALLATGRRTVSNLLRLVGHLAQGAPSSYHRVLSAANGRAALEGFNRFGQELITRDLPAVLLLDQNHGHWEEHAQTNDHRAIAKMPIKMRELRGILLEASRKKVS